MFINIAAVFLIGLLAIFFGWVTRRAWGAGNPFMKWAGSLLAGLLTLMLALITILGAIGLVKYANPKSHAVQELKVEGTPAQIERGRHLAAAFCVQCHSTTGEFPMTGGVDVGKDLPINVGSFVSVNLTPAGPLKDWSDGEIFRAIRDNVDRDGNRLLFMAGTNVRYISDDDIHSLIAFLRSQDPVEKPSAIPADRPNLLGMLMTGANLIPDPPLVEGVVSAPTKAPTAEYGKFMVSFLDCTACHGSDLSGGTSPVSPRGPSLRAVKGWTREQFIAAFRTGRTPAGEELKPPMPWKTTGKLDDVELGALHEYLKSLP